MKSRVKRFLYRMLCGFFLGLSIIAPGVSGSVLAVMMGIYEDLIAIVANPFKNFRRNFIYLFPMGLGALVSVALFIKLLAFAFDVYPKQSMLLLMGLIAGGLLEIFRHVKVIKFKRHYLLGVLISLGLVLAMGLLEPAREAARVSNADFWMLCLAGVAAGIASMIPGLSVSMILMLLGVYDHLLHSASGVLSDFPRFVLAVAPFGTCFIVAMVLFSRLVKTVFDRFPGFAYYMVLGFMLGTLIAVFPGVPSRDAGALIVCVLLFIAGILISAGIQVLGKRFNRDAGDEG